MKVGDKIIVVLSDNTEHLAEITNINETSDIVRFSLLECGTMGEASCSKISKPINSSNINEDSSNFEFIDADEDSIYKFKIVAGVKDARIACVCGNEEDDYVIYAEGSEGISAIETEIDKITDICSGDTEDVKAAANKLAEIFNKNNGILNHKNLEDVVTSFGLTFC